MEARRDEIIDWLIRESGSTRLKATLEWNSVRALTLYAAGTPYALLARVILRVHLIPIQRRVDA